MRLSPFVCPALLAALAGGCVTRAGYTPVGAGRITTGGPAPSAAPGTGELSAAVLVPSDLPEADLRVDYELWLPRAMVVQWRVRCGDLTSEGSAGETFEAYRQRRLAKLAAERERERQRAAKVGSLIGGAVLGQAGAVVAASAPGVTAEAGVVVDGRAVGAAAGAATVSMEVALPAGDHGAGYRRGHLELQAVPAGSCAMEVAPTEDTEPEAVAAIVGSFRIARRDDPRRRRALIADRGAIVLRASLHATLVATGADLDPAAAHLRNAARAEALALARQAELDAHQAAIEARVNLEFEARAKADAQARLRIEQVAWTRSAMVAYLGRCGGDVHRRERRAADVRARAQLAVELDLRRRQLAIGIRGQLHASLIGYGADPGLRDRLLAQAAFEANQRAAAQAVLDEQARELDLDLEARGSVEIAEPRRPPMPPVPTEHPGPPPAIGALWLEGGWTWTGGTWSWSAGSWQLPSPITAGVTVTIGGGGRPTAPTRTPVRDHRAVTPAPAPAAPAAPAPAPARPRTRDHRDGH